jgi:hypothetical protein
MKRIREFFWPILEKSSRQKINKYSITDINISEENIDIALEFTFKIYDSELNRSSIIESKSSLFIGTLSVVTSVVLAVTTALINKNDFNISLFFIVFALFILTIYMVRTIWYSIKVLERKNFDIFYHNDYLIKNAKSEYSKKIIVQLINKTNENVIIINSKVDNMTMAQEYFKRAIIVVGIYSGLVFLFFINKYSTGLINIIKYSIEVINSIYLSSGLIIFFSILFLVSLLINILFYKKK